MDAKDEPVIIEGQEGAIDGMRMMISENSKIHTITTAIESFMSRTSNLDLSVLIDYRYYLSAYKINQDVEGPQYVFENRIKESLRPSASQPEQTLPVNEQGEYLSEALGRGNESTI